MKAYLILVTWPDGTEGLLFPRPGNVPVADSLEMGQKDFDTAVEHLHEYIARAEQAGATSESARAAASTIRLVEFERQSVLKEYKYESAQYPRPLSRLDGAGGH